jgi:hypothetical protein
VHPIDHRSARVHPEPAKVAEGVLEALGINSAEVSAKKRGLDARNREMPPSGRSQISK